MCKKIIMKEETQKKKIIMKERREKEKEKNVTNRLNESNEVLK